MILQIFTTELENERRNIFIIIVLLIGFYLPIAGCNITYKVRNQFNDIDYLLHFPCGKVSIELIGKGNSVFTFQQRFDVETEISINDDSLHVYCNRKLVDYNHDLRKNNKKSAWTSLKNKTNWELSFKLDEGVFEGDTIIVYGNNYLKCHDEYISLDTMVYSFVNNLRIMGVNDIK